VTIAGLVADIAGFLLRAFEWHRTFKYTEEIRQLQLHDAYERNRARQKGREPEYRMEREEEMMAKVFSKLRSKEASVRERIFFVAIALVYLGLSPKSSERFLRANQRRATASVGSRRGKLQGHL
jgi:hypothetical protein